MKFPNNEDDPKHGHIDSHQMKPNVEPSENIAEKRDVKYPDEKLWISDTITIISSTYTYY